MLKPGIDIYICVRGWRGERLRRGGLGAESGGERLEEGEEEETGDGAEEGVEDEVV